MRCRTWSLALLSCSLHVAAFAGAPSAGDSVIASEPRAGVTGAMGVSYISARDIVDLVNATPGTTTRQEEFASVVEFIGAASVPLSGRWALKADYAYLLGSYTVPGLLGQTEYSYAAHLPSLLVQYILFEEGVYNIKAGLGPGYYLGVLTQRDGGGEARYTGSGPGFLLDLEANTALGEDLFAYLGAVVRWSGIGALRAANGSGPPYSPDATMAFFAIGARLGLSYYF